MVRKKDGSNRFCVDYRRLNKVTVFDAEPLPNLEALLADLAQNPNHVLSKIDLSKGYWQVPLAPGAREKSAFQTHICHFQWLVMPFELVTAPAKFSPFMREVLKVIKGVVN